LGIKLGTVIACPAVGFAVVSECAHKLPALKEVYAEPKAGMFTYNC
jgi:hypothetical protein